jgi:hypothetical protein
MNRLLRITAWMAAFPPVAELVLARSLRAAERPA